MDFVPIRWLSGDYRGHITVVPFLTASRYIKDGVAERITWEQYRELL